MARASLRHRCVLGPFLAIVVTVFLVGGPFTFRADMLQTFVALSCVVVLAGGAFLFVPSPQASKLMESGRQTASASEASYGGSNPSRRATSTRLQNATLAASRSSRGRERGVVGYSSAMLSRLSAPRAPPA